MQAVAILMSAHAGGVRDTTVDTTDMVMAQTGTMMVTGTITTDMTGTTTIKFKLDLPLIF